jgi:AraC-like DNA-binding protein
MSVTRAKSALPDAPARRPLYARKRGDAQKRAARWAPINLVFGESTLRDTRVNIGALAQILGYSEVSAFTRFFTSMSGQAPSDWTQRQLAKTDL